MMQTDTAQRRVNRRSDHETVQYHVDGTIAYAPEHESGNETRHHNVTDISRISDREAGRAMSPAYLLFIALISCLTVCMCVNYLQLKERITVQNAYNTELESRLMKLRSENDALLESVNNSVNWKYIKETAINDLGMKYAAKDQIVWYNTDNSGFVKQYRDVPEK